MLGRWAAWEGSDTTISIGRARNENRSATGGPSPAGTDNRPAWRGSVAHWGVGPQPTEDCGILHYGCLSRFIMTEATLDITRRPARTEGHTPLWTTWLGWTLLSTLAFLLGGLLAMTVFFSLRSVWLYSSSFDVRLVGQPSWEAGRVA